MVAAITGRLTRQIERVVEADRRDDSTGASWLDAPAWPGHLSPPARRVRSGAGGDYQAAAGYISIASAPGGRGSSSSPSRRSRLARSRPYLTESSGWATRWSCADRSAAILVCGELACQAAKLSPAAPDRAPSARCSPPEASGGDDAREDAVLRALAGRFIYRHECSIDRTTAGGSMCDSPDARDAGHWQGGTHGTHRRALLEERGVGRETERMDIYMRPSRRLRRGGRSASWMVRRRPRGAHQDEAIRTRKEGE